MAAEFKRGTIRESDGRLYWYTENRKKPDGSIKATQVWLTKEAFTRKKIKAQRASKKIYDSKKSDPVYRAKCSAASSASAKKAWLSKPKVLMVQRAKAKCKKLGLPFNLSPDDFEIPEWCPLLNIKMERGTGQATMASPELDRIVPSLGYVKGNVWVISRRANTIKSNASINEIKLLVANWPHN